MASQGSENRNVVHCLRCHKPQQNLPLHLARRCMKRSTTEERREEIQKAKASSRNWVHDNRTWDYKELLELLPDCSARCTMVKELIQRGFFIVNQPNKGLDAEAGPDNAAPSAPALTRLSVDTPGIKDYQKILSVAKADFLRIHGDLQSGTELSIRQQTLYRYYCEALLVFHHMQRPGAVERLTAADWVDRIAEGGRVVIGVREEETSLHVALTQDEETWFQLYYKLLRPGYKLTTISSQDVRRAVRTTAQKLLAHQQEAVEHYLDGSAGAVQPQDVVDAALLLDCLSGTSLNKLSTAGTSLEEQPSRKDFSAFLAKFPVSLVGRPPSKKQRVESEFPEDRVFYDKWRAAQYTLREKYMLSHFTLHKPSAAKLARLIVREGWKANYPTPEEIQCLWKSAPKCTTKTHKFIIKCVSEQKWPGLAIKDTGPEQDHGVVATQPFSKGDIVCDFHGKVIPAAEGKAMMQDEAGHMFFFKDGARDLCIDAQTFPCECHPDRDTVGRKIHHSSKSPNLKPLHRVLKVKGEHKDVILFKALQDISVDTRLEYGSLNVQL